MSVQESIERLKREGGEPEYAITVPQGLYRRLQALALEQDASVAVVTEHVVKAGLQAEARMRSQGRH